MTKHELASEWGCHPRTIDNLIAEGLPRTKVGRRWDYDERTCRIFRLEREIRMLQEAKRGDADGRTRRELAQAELAEMEVAQRKGSLVPVERVVQSVARLGELFQTRCQAIPGRWTHRVDAVRGHGPARQLLIELIDELLTTLNGDLLTVTPHANGDGKRRRGRPRGPGRTARPRVRRARPPAPEADGQ